ncbi:flagellar protein FlaG [Aeromonas jandaei]|uniref:flagellar protein FlaG n=1 Tax=Aeromonas jandaei TaxID=650 RepID=UPI003BA0BF87
MASEIGNPSSVTHSSLQSNSKSGQQAAPLLSGVPEEQQVTAGASSRDGDRVGHTSHRSNQPPIDVENEVQKLQEFSQLQGWTVSFSVERDLDKVVIRVVDADTRAVIRQIPSEELLSISKRLQALRETDGSSGSRSGLLLDNQI